MPRLSYQAPAIRCWRPADAAPQPSFRPAWFAGGAALLLAMLLLLLPRSTPADLPTVQPAAAPIRAEAPAARPLPPCVTEGLPQDMPTASAVVPRQRLLKGRMLLISEAHPLPADWLPADCAPILQYTGGRVACRDTAAALGQDALNALAELYAAARRERVIQLTVFAGTRSPEQQRQLQTDTFAALARDMALESALAQTRTLAASPGCSEHQTAWAFDIRVCPRWNAPALEEPLAQSEAGWWLMQHAWEYGFIRRWPEEGQGEGICSAYHFRYVGRAHAAIMHALELPLEDYLSLLHEKGALTLLDENGAPLAAAVCAKAGERQVSFVLPARCTVEDLSLDNLGWAVAGCLFSSADAAPAR